MPSALPFYDQTYPMQTIQREQSITSTLSQQTISTESQGIQERGQQIQSDRFPLQYFGNEEVFMKFKLKMTIFLLIN
jgi:hypothetical protein